MTGKSWDETFLWITVECLIHHDMPEQNYVWADFLKLMGFKKYLLPDTCPSCYTVSDFCRDFPSGTYLLVIINYQYGGHVVAVKDGDYYDIWDSGGEVPSYFWAKEEI